MSDWKVLNSGQSLHLLVGMALFYSKYVPYFEMRIKPLRQLLKAYFRKPIPTMACPATLLLLFQDIKDQITSSPILARSDPAKPILLKTNWSAEGMGQILIQPANEKISMAAEDELKVGVNACLTFLSLVRTYYLLPLVHGHAPTWNVVITHLQVRQLVDARLLLRIKYVYGVHTSIRSMTVSL